MWVRPQPVGTRDASQPTSRNFDNSAPQSTPAAAEKRPIFLVSSYDSLVRSRNNSSDTATMKDATKPVVDEEEEKYRKKTFPDSSKIEKIKNLLCTSCNRSVKPSVLKGKVRSHPFLSTLLCEKCYSFYGDGEFSVDEDGSDKYCRWCGQGGTLYLCSTCSAGFCKKCIKRNLPRSILKEVEEDDWMCFCCNVTPLYELRTFAWAAQSYVDSKTSKSDSKNRKKSRRASSDEEGSEPEAKSARSNSPAAKRSSRYKKQKMSRSSSTEQSNEDRHTSKKKSSDKAASPKPGTVADDRRAKEYKFARSQMITTIDDLVQLAEVTINKAHKFKKKRLAPHSVKDETSFSSACTDIVNMITSVEEIANKLRCSFEDIASKLKEVRASENGVNNGEDTSSPVKEDEEKSGADEESAKAAERSEPSSEEQPRKTEKMNEGEEADGGEEEEEPAEEAASDHGNDATASPQRTSSPADSYRDDD